MKNTFDKKKVFGTLIMLAGMIFIGAAIWQDGWMVLRFLFTGILLYFLGFGVTK